ncbi:MAG: aminotransferase class V-fold PLP-dependent enzyme [Acidimicrobiia bacterium]|nr:aminotransferase class V-fold PLP-dependent enzyme [Acidimicrobiia bacterium]
MTGEPRSNYPDGVKSEALIETIRASVIGDDVAVDGPFGPHRITYADYTASGRALDFIEEFVAEAVLPLYANTHTESSGTGLQTTRLREEARHIVRRCLGATDEHAVLFCGSGMTGAMDKLIGVLGLRIPANMDDRYRLSERIPPQERPVVFIGPYEHHSNELPWRESIAEVITIPEDADGHIDLAVLDKELATYADRPLLIGSFSAASNVTGIISDVAAISTLLHSHGALSLWDYAAAAPYVGISMGTAAAGNLEYLDAVMLSPHKLIGGPGTPGVLVARKELFTNRVPAVPGGGTIAYVSSVEHLYLDDIEMREEGGTPDIVGSIRTGLVFQLKEAVGVDAIRRHEESFVSRAVASWSVNANIEVLGNRNAERLSIVSFVVRHGGRRLHHNFVVAVLNDLFGIQARGGCSCAGPYGHSLLGIDLETSRVYEREVSRGYLGIKPGWVRVNFNYFIAETVFSFIVDAVKLVADQGWRLLPLYDFDPASGLWRHRDPVRPPAFSLDSISYEAGSMDWRHDLRTHSDDDLARYLTDAADLFARLAAAPPPPPPDHFRGTDDFESLRWFPLPDETVPTP